MSIETLNNAARAAGFAMAGPEDLSEERRPEAKPEPQGEAWRSAEPVLLAHEKPVDAPKETVSATEWVKNLFAFGRGAPA